MLNYRHLHYFWVVAREGSMTRAAERLDVAVQTVSAQVAQLEQALGKSLLHVQGRTLVLTEAGRTAMAHADQIFQLGDALRLAVAEADKPGRLRLRVGITDGIAKLLAHRLLTEHVPAETRLVCDEDEVDDLLADLALNRLDLVLTDRPATLQGNLRLSSTLIGDFGMAWFATPALAARLRPDWPRSLQDAPVLLPTRHHLLRERIEAWCEAAGLQPDIVAECEDDGLLSTFAADGRGLFAAPAILAADLMRQMQAELLGPLEGVSEQVYAIASEKRIGHPVVDAWLQRGGS